VALQVFHLLAPFRTQQLQAQQQRGDDPQPGDERPDVGLHEQRHPLRRIDVVARVGLAQIGQHLLQRVAEQPVEEMLLRAVVVVHAGLGEPGCPGDIGHRGAFIASLGEDSAGRLEDRRRLVVVVGRRRSSHPSSVPLRAPHSAGDAPDTRTG
jgi:hypothetical protein